MATCNLNVESIDAILLWHQPLLESIKVRYYNSTLWQITVHCGRLQYTVVVAIHGVTLRVCDCPSLVTTPSSLGLTPLPNQLRAGVRRRHGNRNQRDERWKQANQLRGRKRYCVCACVCEYTCDRVCVCVRVCVLCVCVCVYEFVSIHVSSMYVCVYEYICMYVCEYTCD